MTPPADAPPAEAGWVRTLWAVALVQAIMTGSFTIIGPTIPQVLPQLGVETVGGVRAWTGVLMGVTPLMAALTSPLWSNVADRLGRKRIIATTAVGNALLALLMSVCTSAPQLLVLRLAMGSLSGFSAAGISLVAGRAPSRRLGYALGWLSTGQRLGMLIGPVAGGIIADAFHSARAPFLLTATMSPMAAVLVMLVVPKERPAHKDKVARTVWQDLALVARSPLLAPLFLAMLLAQLAIRSVDPVIVLTAQQLLAGNLHMASLAGFAVSVTGLGNLAASPFLGRRSDVIGHRKVLLISLIGAAALTMPQAVVGQFPLFVIERFGVGMFIGGVLPTLNALIGRTAADADRTSVYGVMSSATFLGGFAGPLAGGMVSAAFGLGSVFVVSSLLMVAGLVWIVRKIPADRKA